MGGTGTGRDGTADSEATPPPPPPPTVYCGAAGAGQLDSCNSVISQLLELRQISRSADSSDLAALYIVMAMDASAVSRKVTAVAEQQQQYSWFSLPPVDISLVRRSVTVVYTRRRSRLLLPARSLSAPWPPVSDTGGGGMPHRHLMDAGFTSSLPRRGLGLGQPVGCVGLDRVSAAHRFMEWCQSHALDDNVFLKGW